MGKGGAGAGLIVMDRVPINPMFRRPLEAKNTYGLTGDLEVRLSGHEKEMFNGKEAAVYHVSIEDTNHRAWTVKRRFRQFDKFNARMEKLKGTPTLTYLQQLPAFPKKQVFGNMSEKVIQDRQTDLGQYLKDLMSVSGTCDELRLFLGVFGHHKVEEYEDALKDPVAAMDPAKKPKKPERIKVRLDMGTSGLGARIMIEEGVPGLKIMDIKPGGVIDRAKKISVNDVIYEINGTDVSGFSVQQLQYVLKTSGGTIDLVVEKAATRRH